MTQIKVIMNLVLVILTLEPFTSFKGKLREGEESLFVEQKRSFTSFRACPELAEGMTKAKELIS